MLEPIASIENSNLKVYGKEFKIRHHSPTRILVCYHLTGILLSNMEKGVTKWSKQKSNLLRVCLSCWKQMERKQCTAGPCSVQLNLLLPLSLTVCQITSRTLIALCRRLSKQVLQNWPPCSKKQYKQIKSRRPHSPHQVLDENRRNIWPLCLSLHLCLAPGVGGRINTRRPLWLFRTAGISKSFAQNETFCISCVFSANDWYWINHLGDS